MRRADPTHDEGRPGERAALSVNNGDPLKIPERVDRFLHDALTEVFLSAERAWWLRRAEDFERAKPRLGDNFGRLTREEVRAQWHRLDELARACRARAQVSPVDDIREDVRNVLREAS